MDKTNDVNNLEKAVDAKRAKAESLCLEEKAALITSERGKKTTGTQYYPEGLVYKKERFVGKAVPCSECTLDIITWTEEDLSNKSGTKETMIYARKPIPLLSLFYRSKLVYASEAPLGEPEKLKVNTFKDKGDWLEDLEHIYYQTLLDKELKRRKALADRKLQEVK
jgi:hypothetical protein